MAQQSVRIRNTGTDEFSAGYDGTRYVIKPGSEIIAPWDAACLWLGDPRLWDDTREKNRRKEYDRLCVRYGVYSDGHRFAEAIPSLEVFKLDGDQSRITMLAEDPFGAAVNVWDTENQNDTVEAQVAYLAAQVNELLAEKQAAANPTVASTADVDPTANEDGLPVDSEGAEPVKVGPSTGPARSSRRTPSTATA